MAPILRAQFLGPFRLTYGDAANSVVLPAAINPPHLQSLVAYLLLHGERPHNRSVLADIFSPNKAEPRARHALSQMLWQLRSRLPRLIETDRETVWLSDTAALWVDALEFERQVQPYLTQTPGVQNTSDARASMRHLIQMYRGDLLEGLYDDWLLPAREHLRELYLQTLEELMHMLKYAQHYGQTLEVGHRLLRLLQEAAAQGVAPTYEHLAGALGVSLRTLATDMAAWTYATAPSPNVNYNSAHLAANHAYSVLGWAYTDNQEYIILRNPWGTYEATLNVLGGGVTWTAWDQPYYGGQGWWRPIHMATDDGIFGLRSDIFKNYFAAFGWIKTPEAP